MYKEYAVEPTLICSFDRFRAVIDGKCGWYHGRLIAEYPRSWKRLVYDACALCKDVEKKRIEERLQAGSFLVKREGALPPENGPWISSALAEHARLCFSAVIADGTYHNHPDIHDGRLITESDTAWQVPSGIVPRAVDDYVNAASLLLMNSSRILFIDPHFKPQERRFTDTLRALLEVAVAGGYKRSVLAQFELHLLSVPPPKDTDAPREYSLRLRKLAESYLPKFVPTGQSLSVFIWGRREDTRTGQAVGERFHNRYILTELGGINFGIGLDAAHEKAAGTAETDDLGRMSTVGAMERMAQYSTASSVFQLFQNFDIQGKG